MKKKEGKIYIRNFMDSDVSFKVKMINDKKNNKYLHYDLPLAEDKTLSWLKRINDDDSRLDLTILYDNKIVGVIGLLNIDKKNKKAEYYVCVDSSFSGKGIGSISTRLLLQYAFDDMELNKIYLFTEEENERAQHLFEKIGFIKEGLLKNDIVHNGKYINRFAYGICKEDYYAKDTNSYN